ncbi:A disintegrin and metalloproteinase with thrombospondin motifs 9-like isoform X2 [Hylaeus volcanicus]|uniref:A disintegrin and metalloproteinase with thrombospondin motifs 9-like isoform X2 n=1 Tax=Hylaeus volcanicus TaxID=313075 RepID=UPI0023B780EF|nr:A disintegrin and metalloproteinase with thrombospondin motifs 9-like isoform X2 [Hylaeus volcanicus]
MSRISNRVSIVAAIVSIVLLVIFLVIIWTGVRSSNASSLYGDEGRLDSGLGPLDVILREGWNQSGRTEAMFDEANFTEKVVQKVVKSSWDNNRSSSDASSASNPDLEYVRLMKISENQYEDPPEKYSTAQRHHSGHFRHATAEVWDPHPQYEFTAFGRRFRLRLAHDSSFFSPNIKITHISENTTRREHPGHELGCFYSGTVDDDPYSAVTVSLCHGMTGHVRTSTGSYIIKPTEPWSENDNDSLQFSLQHAIQRLRTSTTGSNHLYDVDDQPKTRNCGVIDDDTPTPISDDTSGNEVYVGGRSRKRRSLTEKTALDHSQSDEEYEQFREQRERHQHFLQNDNRYERYYSVDRRRNDVSEEYTQDSKMESDPFVTWRPRRALPREYFIEIMVVADDKMEKYHGKALFSYILVLMSMVSRLYKDQSIGNPVSISVMKIVRTNEIFAPRHNGREGIAASDMLKGFCKWQKHNNPDEPSPEHHDAALLLTRENLCHNPDEMRCDTLGLAELGRMCSPGSSCAIVQDNGLAAAFTIAHEIGHVLNMPHDDDDTKCRGFRNRSGVHNIMSRMLDDNTFPWEWSACSRHYVTEFLEAGNGNCLLDKPATIMEMEDASRLSGEDYSANKQCELVFGRGSRICSHMVSDVCRRLWCTAPKWDHHDECHTQYMPWADGTACGYDKWCHRGKCVSRTNLEPVHGQWGEWGRYGECSRTCGGGIKKKYRECNSPLPQNGGNYCVGDRVKYRSCGTKECPPGSPDFREQQCSQFDNNNRNIPNVTKDVKWHAKYTRILPQDRCILYCQVESNQYYMQHGKVIDGTPCGLDTFDVCVNGHCKPAGCDHVLNSMAKLDTCGVCRGDNSTCQRITGTYNSTQYGYTRVTKIPAGSSNIDIRQYGWMNSKDDNNYLALRLGEGGKYILNGNFMVMHQKVIAIVQSGVTIEYSGPESVVERLNSSRPIGTDLILEVLSVPDEYPPQITYEYTVPKKILDSYTWVLSNWSECSYTCQGVKYRKAKCRSTEHKDVVSDDYCREEDKPREESQLCNRHCYLKWQITSKSECSSHCGSGTRAVTSKCFQILYNSNYPPRPVHAQACAHLQRPNEKEACSGPCENVHWNYGEWGSCSVTCGGGVQYRTAVCEHSNGRPVSEDNCARQEKYLKRICGQDACPKWDFEKWTPCSVTCGVGKRRRQYLCHVDNRIVSHSHCGDSPPEVVEACNAGPCDQWQVGDWSTCSVTCGEGIKQRKVLCKTSDGTTSNKCSNSDKPEDIASCQLHPCPIVEDPSQQGNEVGDIIFRSGYQWHVGSYKECSKPCIDGYMSTVVKCVSTETETIAPDDYCDRKKKPLSAIPCNPHRCPMWNTGDWSQCNVECDAGFQHRQVRCQSPYGEILPDDSCHDSEKPEVVKICRKSPCMTPTNRKNRLETNIFRKWKVSNWTSCSKSCGSGLQRRRVECTMRRGNHGPEVTVKDEQCSRLGLAKPRSQRSCRRVACDYIWQEDAWSECSAKCGQGIQRRTVTCYRTNRYGVIDPAPSDNCPMDQKPSTEQTCKLRDCDDKYYWTAGPWKKCSHTCGQKGRQTRRLFCHDRTGKKVMRVNCPLKHKPPRKQKCNQRKCYPVSCLEAKKYFKTTNDTEYTLIVSGRSMSIYCHGMATSEPKEYLTLVAGPRENYAEIYDKRLIDSRTCPYNGQRNNSCDCATDVGTISGKTMFKRVRLDPVKLYITENDYTFSWTEGANRVKYGMAGDCYSRVYCPQGRFSINLSGTRLKLSSDVTWTGKPGVSMEINNISNQRVTGKCGGYCGFCHPKIGLKLDVLPP